MAQLYTIKCPKCGAIFKVPKGVLMSWDFSNPIPVELREETPFSCPNCNYTMCVKDEDFHKNVEEVIHLD